MDVDRVGHVGRVAARERDHHGHGGAGAAGQHELVAGAQPGLGQRQAPERVTLPRVGARDVERQLGGAAAERLVQRAVERLEVVVVARPRRQLDVEVGGDALEGPVALALDAERERLGVGAEQLGRAVALVHVAVDDDTRRSAPARRSSLVATARSLNTQNPRAAARAAWWVPPPSIMPWPSASASCGGGQRALHPVQRARR